MWISCAYCLCVVFQHGYYLLSAMEFVEHVFLVCMYDLLARHYLRIGLDNSNDFCMVVCILFSCYVILVSQCCCHTLKPVDFNKLIRANKQVMFHLLLCNWSCMRSFSDSFKQTNYLTVLLMENFDAWTLQLCLTYYTM